MVNCYCGVWGDMYQAAHPDLEHCPELLYTPLHADILGGCVTASCSTSLRHITVFCQRIYMVVGLGPGRGILMVFIYDKKKV